MGLEKSAKSENFRKKLINCIAIDIEFCRQGMQEIKTSNIENIIIDCSYEILNEVLKQAQQVGILSDKYKVIVTNLVRYISALNKLKIKL